MRETVFNKSFISPEGLIQFEITPITASMELLFHAKCWLNDQLFSFHLGINDDCGEITVIPKQMVPYAVHEIRDQLSTFIAGQYE
jgi:hypothetical protein